MIFSRSQSILFAVMLCGVAARAQVSVNVAPPSAKQILVAQQPVDVDSPVTATASFDPPIATPGETVYYRVELDASEGMIQWPDKISFPDGLGMIAKAQGETVQSLPGRFRPLTSYAYELSPTNTGEYTVPAFNVQVSGQTIPIPAATFRCVTNKPESVQFARQLILEASQTNVYLGEPLMLRVRMPTLPGAPLAIVRDVQFISDGFMTDKSSMRQLIQMEDHNGKRVPTYSFEQVTTPIGAGERMLRAQGFVSENSINGPITISGGVVIGGGGPPHYVLLMSNPVKIRVRPLPVAGKLPGFTGGIGTFSIGATQLSTNRLSVGMPIELKIAIKGQSNLDHLVPPPPPRVNDWQIIPDPDGNFSYTLIPLTDQVKATPAIPFSCFDPERGRYVDLTIPSLPVTVAPEKLPERLPASEYTESDEPTPQLSALATSPGKSGSLQPLQLQGWFIALQSLPVLLFVGLWQWGRHREYLEAHPEIVRRRRAKRDLKRQNECWKKAVHKQDTIGFVQHAVAALRVVCAPHYPANPRALVCADVLAQLTDEEKQSQLGETVRTIFAAADSEFSVSPETGNDLLALETELAAVLQRLEARL